VTNGGAQRHAAPHRLHTLMETKMKRTLAVIGATAIGVVAAVAIAAGAANAASTSTERVLPASNAQAAAIVPMAIPNGSCIRSQGSTMTTLFVLPGVAVSRAQMADHMGVSVASVIDSTWPASPAPGGRVTRNGENWAGQAGNWAAIGSTSRSDVPNFHVIIVNWTPALPC
jgi:hypothetical protein